MSLKFWETHAKEMRKARLLQASAIIFATSPNMRADRCVDNALVLEEIVDERLRKLGENDVDLQAKHG